MIREPVTIEGVNGEAIYLNADWTPAESKDAAVLIKVWLDNGQVLFALVAPTQ